MDDVQSASFKTTNPDHVANLKLPTINLPVFSGAYDEWTTFHDTFTQLIDIFASLTNIQKFYYLKSCLENDASHLIQTIEISDNNYSVAVYQTLKFSNAQGFEPQSNQTNYKQKLQEHTFAITDHNEHKCHFCEDGHFIYNCAEFLKLSVPEEYNEIKKLKLCCNCPGHLKWECKSGKCK